MHRHLQERHPRNAVAADELKKFSEAVVISEEEETKMGIPAEKQGRSMAYDSYDARRMNCLPTIHNVQEDSPRRLSRQVPFSSSSTPPPPFHLPTSYNNSSRNEYIDPFN